MEVLGAALLYIHVQCMVRMVVVILILHVNGQVRHFTCALADAESPQHGQRLPQKDSQQDERTQAGVHSENSSSQRSTATVWPITWPHPGPASP